jgi:hypothetical protein
MHLFNNLAKVILEMKSGTLGRPPKPAVAAASSTVTGKTYYWRGFLSARLSTGAEEEEASPERGEVTCTQEAAGAAPDPLPTSDPARLEAATERTASPTERIVHSTFVVICLHLSYIRFYSSQ